LRLLAREAGAGSKVGTIGFSAGGHVAGSLASRFAERTYEPVDQEDERPARPAFAGLFFPVITMTDPFAHGPSRRNLIGKDPGPERIRRWSLEQNVPADMPPTFLAAAADDKVLPVENTMMMFAALRRRKVPSAVHIFDFGGHGFGKPTDPNGPGHFWPKLFEDWLARQTL
jgi:acetyl esterase/lipase